MHIKKLHVKAFPYTGAAFTCDLSVCIISLIYV